MAQYGYSVLGTHPDEKLILHEASSQNVNSTVSSEFPRELYNVLYCDKGTNGSEEKKNLIAMELAGDLVVNDLQTCGVENSAMSGIQDFDFLPGNVCSITEVISPVTHIEIIKSGSRRVTGANRVVPLLTSALKTGKSSFSDFKLFDVYKGFLNDVDSNDNNKKCMICHELLLSSTELEDHIRNIHAIDVAVDQCFVCSKKYIFHDQLRIHLSLTHSINCPDLICKICFMEFNTSSEQKAHERKHDESHTCQVCNKKFSSEYLYQRHLNQHIFQEKPNECKKCGKRFKSEVALNIHKKRHVNVTCTACNVHFLNDTDLLLHTKEHCDDDVLTLLKNIELLDEEECQLEEMLSIYSELSLKTKLSDQKNLENDAQENSILDCVNTMISTISQFNGSDERSKKGMECRLCGVNVSSDKELLDHRKQFHLRNRTCPFCGKRSRSVSQTWRHMHSHIVKNKINSSKLFIGNEKQIAPNSGDNNEGHEVLSCAKTNQSRKNSRLYSCNICSRKFLYPGSRDNHMLQHSKEKSNNWSCTVCGQVFSNPELLLTHASAHEPAMTCQICGKPFCSHKALQIHLKTHFGEPKKVFKCNICFFEFPSLSRLQTHRRCHTGERPYTCGQCHRKFKRRQAVRKHIQVVHNSASLQYHKCSHCTRMFNSSGNLVRHYLRVHFQVRRFICGVCGSRFSQNQDLRRHFKVAHAIEMPKINGSDRKALREIYVIPDIDDLSETNPHALKIKAIVAEEKAKFNRLSELLANRVFDKVDPTTESLKELVQNFSNKGGEETVNVLQKSVHNCDNVKKVQTISCSELGGISSPAEYYDFKNRNNSDSTKEKLYLCEYCHKNFPGENEYMEHIAERSKSYMCKQCSSVFCDQILLNEHIGSEHNILQSNIAVNDLNSGNYLKHIHNINDVQIIHSMSTVPNELQGESCQATEKNTLMSAVEKQELTLLYNTFSDPTNFISNNDIDGSKSGLPLSSGDLNNISTTLNINGFILQNVIIQSTPAVLHSVPLGLQNQEIVNTDQVTPVVTFSSPAITPIDNHSFLNGNDNSLSVSTCMDSANSVIDPETVFEKVNQKILVPAVNYTVNEIKSNVREENIKNTIEEEKQKIIVSKPPALNDVKGDNESKESKKIKCKHCGEKFHSSSSLNRHKKSHSGKKEFGCPDCSKRFSERFNLKAHMMTHSGERPYQCEGCGKQLRYKKDVLDHKRMHLGERPFECEECGRKFIRQRELNRHKVIHTGEKKYECPICGKTFRRLDQLRHGHLPTHSDSNSCPKHICSICNRSFKLKSQLKQHEVLHTGLKPYKCELCEKSFALGIYLKAHMQCHKKRDTYVQCPKCPRRFTSETTLHVHDRSFHARLKKRSKTSDLGKEETYKVGDDANLPNENSGNQRQLDNDIEIHDVDLSVLDANNCNAVIFLQMVPEELSFDVDS